MKRTIGAPKPPGWTQRRGATPAAARAQSAADRARAEGARSGREQVRAEIGEVLRAADAAGLAQSDALELLQATSRETALAAIAEHGPNALNAQVLGALARDVYAKRAAVQTPGARPTPAEDTGASGGEPALDPAAIYGRRNAAAARWAEEAAQGGAADR